MFLADSLYMFSVWLFLQGRGRGINLAPGVLIRAFLIILIPVKIDA